MTKQYASVIFIQDYNLVGQDRDLFVAMLDNRQETELFEYLLQWEHGDNCGETSINKPWGSSDNRVNFKDGNTDYVLTYNPGLGYAGLTRIFE